MPDNQAVDDLMTAHAAVIRWADQCRPGDDKHLREVANRIGIMAAQAAQTAR